MGNRRHFSIWLSEDLIAWIDDQAGEQKRSRNNFLENILEDLRAGKLIRKKEVEETVAPTLRRAY